MRGHIGNVPQSFGLSAHGESSCLSETDKRNVFTSSFFVVPHRVLRKYQHLQGWQFPAELSFCCFAGWPWWQRHGRWSSSCCGRQGKRLAHVHMSHFGPCWRFRCVCAFRKSSRLARPDGARTRSSSSQFCVWGTASIFFEVSATRSRREPTRMKMNTGVSSSF